jgi:cytoskeletal protein CcmA (bactofilin family)
MKMKRILKKVVREQKGQALVAVLILLLLGGLVTAPVVTFVGTGVDTGAVYEEDMDELYAADGGIEDAIRQIIAGAAELPSPDDPVWSYQTADINGKEVEVIITYIDDTTYKVTSTASTDADSSTTIESYVTSSGGSSIFDNAITALNGNITLGGNAKVTSSPASGEGNIFANGDIDLSGNAKVEGDGTATGEISTSGNSQIEGDETEGAIPLTPPDIDSTPYLQEAELGGIYEGDLSLSGNGYYDLGPLHITGNLSISGNRRVRLGGTVYVDGTITMSGNTRIEGGYTIVAENSISLTGNSKLDLEDIPFVFSTDGNITTTGNNWTSAVVYAPNGHVNMSGNSRIYGAVLGLSITGSGNNKIEYPLGLGDSETLPSVGDGSYHIRTWEINP